MVIGRRLPLHLYFAAAFPFVCLESRAVFDSLLITPLYCIGKYFIFFKTEFNLVVIFQNIHSNRDQ